MPTVKVPVMCCVKLTVSQEPKLNYECILVKNVFHGT